MYFLLDNCMLWIVVARSSETARKNAYGLINICVISVCCFIHLFRCLHAWCGPNDV